MRLYYFTTKEYGLQNLEKRRLKVARILDLNDPFEFIALKLGAKVQRQALRRRRDEIDQNYGIICFSDRWCDPLMWSHYADRHRGICLGFEIADAAQPTAIRYIRDLPDPTALGYSSLEEMTDKQRMEMGFVKSTDWKYERERRLIIKLAEAQPEEAVIKEVPQILYFQPFTDHIKLKEVIVGARCQLGKEELHAVIGDGLGKIEMIKARLAFKSFTVIRQNDPTMWRPSEPTAGDGP
ncbi:DUF2971 domain-containing protein [Rhizobium sp. CB3060]|uniref:DUF2971 domain-containing protein n=1 Tax=Rhizobium sp. CB3060 TaxID=3138255 RepID=UPI0021A3ADE6|nr:DUF2971 domain-containing protein [Rhizobium tropici]UWU23058.1 DUF2971 domain-containing protein [Rhizobium tropici]